MPMVLASLLLATAAPAAPPIVQEAAPAANTTPLLMNSIDDLRQVCGERKDIAMKLACVSWINGASQIHARFRSLAPPLMPDFCPPAEGLNLGRQREVLVAWLAANPRQRSDRAIIGYRKAMAAAFPCPAGA